MNIIKTVGDLKNLLSAYWDSKPIFVLVDGKQIVFKDYQISQRNAEFVEIHLYTNES